MREFIVNDLVTLKLENDKTVIYVNDKRFEQCKFLLLDIPIEKATSLSEIESIDEAAEKLDRSMEVKIPNSIQISPELEFWGHCSNMQVWVENNYDTRMLHRNIAFPLLKRLVDEEDNMARKVFKEEIAIRLESGHPSVTLFLINNGYLDYLEDEEFDIILENSGLKLFNHLMTTNQNNQDNQYSFPWNYFKNVRRNKKNYLKKLILKILNDNLNFSSFLFIVDSGFWDFLDREEQDDYLQNPSQYFVKHVIHATSHEGDWGGKYSFFWSASERIKSKLEVISPKLLSEYTVKQILNAESGKNTIINLKYLVEDDVISLFKNENRKFLNFLLRMLDSTNKKDINNALKIITNNFELIEDSRKIFDALEKELQEKVLSNLSKISRYKRRKAENILKFLKILGRDPKIS